MVVKINFSPKKKKIKLVFLMRILIQIALQIAFQIELVTQINKKLLMIICSTENAFKTNNFFCGTLSGEFKNIIFFAIKTHFCIEKS